MKIATRDTALGLTIMSWVEGGEEEGERVDGGNDKRDIATKKRTSRAKMSALIQHCLARWKTRDGTYVGGGGERRDRHRRRSRQCELDYVISRGCNRRG